MGERKKDTDNIYANTIENIPVHISQVESGRKGYYCQGCGREMIARKGNILMHHFSHDPKDVKNKGKCTYSDETYRHKLAKEILQRIKRIKVPALYKYPPLGVEGKPNKLKDAEFIKAETVRNELTFFEDEEGFVSYGNNIDIEDGGNKFLLIKPDVTFFDENDNPILLIEIVATHKITDEKLAKIRKLGINTVQITIPKDSPEEIENTFYKTTRTEWVFNYEQEKAIYIRTAKGDGEDVPSLTDLQRRLLEIGESYECRAFQIRDLIRGLNKCLESQPYIESASQLREELQRSEINTEIHRERLRRLQEEHKTRIEDEMAMEARDVEQQERTVTEESKLLDAKRRELESRYYSKKEEIEREEREFRTTSQPEIDRIEAEFERLGTSAVEFRKRSDELRKEEANLEQRYRDEIARIEESTRIAASAIADIKQRRAALQGEYHRIEEEIRAEFEQKATISDQYSETRRTELRGRFERYRRTSLEAIETRDSERISRVRRGLRVILETRDKLTNLSERKIHLRRLRKFKELFDQGAYKNWI